MIDVSEQDSHWRVLKIGLDPVSSLEFAGRYESYIEQWRRQYARFGDMPIKTQESVAALSMIHDGERIKDLGMRVSATTFWLDDNDELLKEYEDE